MKKLPLLIGLMISIAARAQDKAVLQNDTIYYHSLKFYVGDTIQLGSGSSPNNSFGFIHVKAGFGNTANASASWSKAQVVITKVYRQSEKCFAMARSDKKDKLYVDIEGAVDHKEIWFMQ